MAKRIFFLCLIICSTGLYAAAQKGSAARKQERKDIDSLLLVHSLPVSVSGNDSLFRKDIQTLLRDSLKTRNFECLNYDEAFEISKKFFGDLFGVNNKQKMLENIEKSKTDKEHYIKEMQFAKPLFQSVIISACSTEPNNCIVVQRYNFPNGTKKKSWEFMYEQSETINQLVSRIIDSLISYNTTQ